MFDKIVDFSLRNRAAVLFFTLLVAIWGWVSFKGLTIEAFPDPTDTQVQVITLFPGQPSEEVERQIGLPLERALNVTEYAPKLHFVQRNADGTLPAGARARGSATFVNYRGSNRMRKIALAAFAALTAASVDAIPIVASCMPRTRLPSPRALRMRVRASSSGSPERGSCGR